MATFKVTEDFDIDVSTLDAAAFNINTNLYAVEDIAKMQTASQFYRQHQAIKELLDLYARFIAKEATDLANMAEETRDLDRVLVVKLSG